MKAIILISSIFFLLGLKIGNKTDLLKKERIISPTISNTLGLPAEKSAIQINNEKQTAETKPETDSVGCQSPSKLLAPAVKENIK